MLCDDAPEVRLHVGPGGDEAGLFGALSRQDLSHVFGGIVHSPVDVVGRGRAGIALISTKKDFAALVCVAEKEP